MPFPTTPILDSFTRADEGPPPSASWSNTFNGLKVVSNECAGNAVGQNISFWNASTPGGGCEAYATIRAKPANTNGMGICARLKDTGAIGTLDGYLITALTAVVADTIRIDRLDNGVATTLGSTISQEFSVGDKIGIRCVGSNIQAWYFNGTSWSLLGTRVDTTYPDAGRIGLIIQNILGRWDDFGGGNYVAGGLVDTVRLKTHVGMGVLVG